MGEEGRSWWKTAGALASCLLLAVRVEAAGELLDTASLSPLEWSGPGESKIRVSLAERLRGEFVDWFGDPRIAGTIVERESRYDFLGHKLQVGASWSGPTFDVFAQVQNTVLDGLPRNGVGVGSVYFANTPDRTQATVFLRQGWARLRQGPFSVSLGRQLYRDAAQGLASDPSLRWIQEMRWSQRLIGPFDYTHTGRSFDGAALALEEQNWALSGFAFLPTFGGFETDAMRNIPEIRVAGLNANWLGFGSPLPPSVARVFWTFYEDERDLVTADNRPLATRQQTAGKSLQIHTIGGNAASVFSAGDGKLDVMAFFYGQVGDWQDLDHRAWAYGVEAGYRWPQFWASPWLRAGINAGSGDDDPRDHTHGTFFQMLPTAWQYAMFPFFNMMNTEDVFVQGILSPTSWCNLRLDWHWLRASDRHDLIYSGGGATSDTFFGYAGTTTGGEKELAHLVQVYGSLRVHANASVNFFYGHAFGQAILAQQYSARNGDYGFVETQLSF